MDTPRSVSTALALTGALAACAPTSDAERLAPGPDAALPDAVAPDARAPDTLAPAPDAAPPDAALPDAAPPDAGPICNGRADLCARPYNDATQVCTHNAMSSTAYRFIIPKPNQAVSITAQLDAGVRCLMLDTYLFEGERYLCHGVCGNWGKLKLADGLREVATWLAAHPRDVVTFILEAYIDEVQTRAALEEVGLAAPGGAVDPAFPLFHADGPPGTPWPTLGEMVDTNRRLVVFTDDPAANGTWHLHWPTFGFETPYNDPTFTCEHGRGDPTAGPNRVFILNHYSLGPAGGDVMISSQNNAYDTVLEHGRRCRGVDPANNPFGQRPTFVNVDHFQVPVAGGGPGREARPDVLDAVETLNDE
jgi:hypothetical protein